MDGLKAILRIALCNQKLFSSHMTQEPYDGGLPLISNIAYHSNPKKFLIVFKTLKIKAQLYNCVLEKQSKNT